MKYLLTVFALHMAISAAAGISDQPQWITSPESQNATNTWICFVRNFEVDEVPTAADTRIAADSKYWLWINGEPVVFEGGVKRGPNPDDTYFDRIDIAPYLKKGANNISILLWYFGKDGFSHNSSGRAGLFFDCRGDNGFALAGGRAWRTFLHPSFSAAGHPVPNYRLPESSLLYDARVAIDGWNIPGYDVTGWKPAKTLGPEGSAPWNKLHHRVIPLWRDYGLTEYVSTELRPGNACTDTLICKLPYNTQITPWFRVSSPAGKKIVIHTDHYREGGPHNIRAEYITRQGEQEYESPGWINGHHVYYLIPRGVEVLDVKFRETVYDTDFAGSFECSDDFLNILWQKSLRTLLVTMRDTYMDCPDRERAQWWGDEVNESGEAFYALCRRSDLLMKKGMYELIGWQRPDGTLFSPVPASNFNRELPGQMLASVGYYGFWNYYLNTGDKESIGDLYDGVIRYLKVWRTAPNGTIAFRKGDWAWGDWGTNIDRHALYNAWYYLALKGVHRMALVLEREADARRFETEMTSLKKAFNDYFWTGSEYRSPNYADQTDDRVHALAVVGGLADADKYPAILGVLKNQHHASPYMEKYVIEALFRMGEGEYGIKRMKSRFAEMVNDPDRTTLYENWSIGGKTGSKGTANHAWSGGGLTILSQYVSGVEPVEPGYRVFSVLPQPAGIGRAQSTVPSIAGEIRTSFTDEANLFMLNIKAPEGTECIAGIPSRGVKRITCNGQTVWKNGRYSGSRHAKAEKADEMHIRFRIPAGTSEFKAYR